MKNKSWIKRLLPIFVVGFLAIITCWFIQLGYAQIKIAFAEAQMSRSQGQIISKLSTNNQDLKNKLARSFTFNTPENVKALTRFYIQKYFGKDAQVAEKVFTCESGLNPQSLNTKNSNGSVDRGIPQINSVHAKEFERMYGISYAIGAHDTDLSIRYAKYLFDHQGFSPWVCYRIVNREVAKL